MSIFVRIITQNTETRENRKSIKFHLTRITTVNITSYIVQLSFLGFQYPLLILFPGSSLTILSFVFVFFRFFFF